MGHVDWYANIEKTTRLLRWQPRTGFEDGLNATAAWYRGLADKERYHRSSKQFGLDTKHSVTAMIACYKDGQAIPIMYGRLKASLPKLGIDYEIIFVNDCSPDDSEEMIRAITRNDRRVIGISHSRNFGSQAAFRSGMEMATKNACVLLDGDLQDPPGIDRAVRCPMARRLRRGLRAARETGGDRCGCSSPTRRSIASSTSFRT